MKHTRPAVRGTTAALAAAALVLGGATAATAAGAESVDKPGQITSAELHTHLAEAVGMERGTGTGVAGDPVGYLTASNDSAS